MVENTGKTLRVVTGRTVNAPEPVDVEEASSFSLPLAVRAPRRQAVVTIDDRWRIDDEWWRAEPVSRMYYEVTLSSGLQMMLFKDLVNGGWFRQSY
ncbi:MAG: hypothetical protein JW712_06440 [Dehalococcoidales bacterium]|nr:hypothetical protein [Dehalococcoidales bacterium]